MVLKQCPKCEQQVPVACKSCPCGHHYFSARRLVRTGGGDYPNSSEETTECGAVKAVKRRRSDQRSCRQGTLRTRTTGSGRLGPSTTTNLLRNRRRQVQRSPRQLGASSSGAALEDGGEDNGNNGNKRRKRGRRRKIENPSSDDREGGSEKEEVSAADILSNVSPEKANRYSVILAEINRKIGFSQL